MSRYRQNEYSYNVEILRKYGLTRDEFEEMLEKQFFCCRICGRSIREGACVDHNHKTGKVRGLLCMQCNTALGLLGDSIRTLSAAIVYLEDGKQ